MLEIVIFVVVGAVIYSTIQGVRRGDVSDDERKKNPTLVESVADFTSEMADRSRRHRAQTKFELEYCAWFRHFERNVSRILEDAKYYAELQEKLDADPECKKIFDEIMSKYDPVDIPKDRRSEPEWVSAGPPPVPAPVDDPDTNSMRKRVFENQRKRHQEFVDRVRSELDRSPLLRKKFVELMGEVGLKALVQVHFPAMAPLSHAANGGKEQRARKVSSREASTNNTLKRNVGVGGTNDRVLVPMPTVGGDADDPVGASIRTHDAISSLANSTNYGHHQEARITARRRAKSSEDKISIEGIVESRGIEYLIHFTQADNLASIVRQGLLSVEEAKRRGVNVRTNDANRYDGYLNAISVSVSFPNAQMFYKLRKLHPEIDWVLLLIDPAVLFEKRCGFCRFNAADKRTPKRNEGALMGARQFEQMFDRSIPAKDPEILAAMRPDRSAGRSAGLRADRI